MAITSRDQLIDASGNAATSLIIAKGSVASQVVGGYTSGWRLTGLPAQGAIPGAAANCNEATTGAFALADPTGGRKNYVSRWSLACATAMQSFELHDRLAHMGGLSGTLTTAQTVGVDVSVTTDNMAVRRGSADYSDVQWWLEWYTTTGGNAATATVTYTNAAGTTGRTTTVTVPATTGASRAIPIIGNGGEFIRSVQSVTLSTGTGVAGSFGVTATRELTDHPGSPAANALQVANGADVWCEVPVDACLMLIGIAMATTFAAVNGNIRVVQG